MSGEVHLSKFNPALNTAAGPAPISSKKSTILLATQRMRNAPIDQRIVDTAKDRIKSDQGSDQPTAKLNRFVLGGHRTSNASPSNSPSKTENSPRPEATPESKDEKPVVLIEGKKTARSEDVETLKEIEVKSIEKSPEPEALTSRISDVSSKTLLTPNMQPLRSDINTAFANHNGIMSNNVLVMPDLPKIPARPRQNAMSTPKLQISSTEKQIAASSPPKTTEASSVAPSKPPAKSTPTSAPAKVRFKQKGIFKDIQVTIDQEQEALGKGVSGVVREVKVKGNEKPMALKQPPNEPTPERQKLRNQSLKDETATTIAITSCKNKQGYLDGLPAEPILGEVNGKPSVLMEKFDGDLEIKTKSKNSPYPNEIATIMDHTLSGLDNITSKGYSWVDGRPANIAKIGGRYVCFDFGASEKLENFAGARTPTYTTSEIKTDKDGLRMDLDYMHKFVPPNKINVEELKGGIRSIINKESMNIQDIKKLLFFNDVIPLGFDKKTIDDLKTHLASKESSKTLDHELKNEILNKIKDATSDTKTIVNNVKQKINDYKDNMKSLNHKKDVLALGISYYEIMFQKLNSPSFNDHFIDADKCPRFDVMIDQLKDFQAQTQDVNLKKYANAIIAMLDPIWTRRPSVKEIQAYLNDPDSQPAIEKRIEDLKKLAGEYKDLNNKYQSNPNSVDINIFQQKEKELFGNQLSRTQDNKIMMKVEVHGALYIQLEQNYYSKPTLTPDEINQRNDLERKLFNRTLQRDRDGNLTPEDEELREEFRQNFSNPV